MAEINATILTFTGAIQHKRGTSAALEASDYVAAAGEILIATDTGEMRAGNGKDLWKDLPSYNGDLNDRIAAFEGITGIDCGEITASGSGN